MAIPVNLTHLRKLTNGDPAIERNLFEAFLQSSAASIEDLQRHTEIEHAEIWRRKAQALKGICLNLGATPLGALCKHAQEEFMVPAGEKERMLAKIVHEYGKVTMFLRNISA